MRDRSGEIAEVTAVRMQRELPDYYRVSSPDYLAAAHGSLPAILAVVWATFDHGGHAPQRFPASLVDEAVGAARNGVDWQILDRSYSITHQDIWDAVLGEVASWRLDTADQKAALRQASRCLFECFDWLTNQASQVYQAERSEWFGRRQKRLLEVVEQAINGLAVPDSELGYVTDQEHVATIAWGTDPLGAITSAARLLDAAVLTVPCSRSIVWGWLGHAQLPDYEAVLAAFTPAKESFVAVSAIERGRRGFVSTHLQAQFASGVAGRHLLATERSVIAYPEIAVESFALADEAGARIFVHHVLGPLAADDDKSARQRDTLRAYCDAGMSPSAAAVTLGVVERTVRYRIRALEQELGAIPPRTLEVALALRLFDALAGQATRRLLRMADYPTAEV
jgi:hypothetical protein